MPENDNKAPPIVLDAHRGLTSQKETEARRHRSVVKADQAALRQSRVELEKFLFAAPAADWPAAARKALHLLGLLAATAEARDPRLKQLIDDARADLNRLSEEKAGPGA